ncbi:MAG: HNH endonuclease signature motif containing protein, partial [Phycisphaerae bacterium]
MSKPRILSKEDSAKLAADFRAGATLTQLSKRHNCNWYVFKKAILSQMTRREYTKLVRRNISLGCSENRFTKGTVPWNKGLKGVHYSPSTEFKKGHLPANHKHRGVIVIRRDKCGKSFRYIKISGIMQCRHKWIPYARYLWLKSGGSIPKGYFVVHCDGDTLNDNINNLRCVDRAGHLALQMQRDAGIRRRCIKANLKAQHRRKRENLRLKALKKRQRICLATEKQQVAEAMKLKTQFYPTQHA